MAQEKTGNLVVQQEKDGANQAAQGIKAPLLSEDWLAVIIGAIVIIGVLLLAPTLTAIEFKLPTYRWADAKELSTKVFAPGNLLLILEIGLLYYVLATLGIQILGGKIRNFVIGFPVIYLLAIAALIIAGNATLSKYGLEYVVWSLAFGLIIGNFFQLPDWLKEASRSEFYIKTGLVILGISILFTDIVQAGLPGILQAFIVVIVVWYFAFWLAKRLGVDDEFAAILATAVSICGVSAAIAAAGAIKGDRKKLSYTTTIVVLVAVPMIIIVPWLIRTFGISEIVGGAWLGGTLDTTASVTAAGELIGPIATKAGTIVKFSQNVLIGLAAFFLAIWWTVRENPNSKERPSARVIWERFPKFVLGFIAASLVFSFVLAPETAKSVTAWLNGLRTLWFALAFISIGLEARFANLIKLDGGRPAIAFIGAQTFNVVFTLIIAYLLFGGILLPIPVIQ